MSRRSRFSREFKVQAVRLAGEPGNTFASVGRDLGCSGQVIGQWARALAVEEDPVVQRAVQEHNELLTPRRRVRLLEEEREILAKAAAFLARETGRTP